MSDQPIASMPSDVVDNEREEEVMVSPVQEDEEHGTMGSSVFLRVNTLEQTVFANNGSNSDGSDQAAELQPPLPDNFEKEEEEEEEEVPLEEQQQATMEPRTSAILLRVDTLEQTVFARQSTQEQDSSARGAAAEVTKHLSQMELEKKKMSIGQQQRHHPGDNPDVVPASRSSSLPVQRETIAMPMPGATAVQGINSSANDLVSDDATTTNNIDASTGTVEVGDGNNHRHRNSSSSSNNSSNANGSSHLIQAYPVGEEEQETINSIRASIQAQVEEEVRQTILQDAVEANVVSPSSYYCWSPTRTKMTILVGLSLLLVLCVVFVLFLLGVMTTTEGDDNTKTGETDPSITVVKNSTLDEIRERGYIRCGTYMAGFGFALPNPNTGQLEGMNADHCRAIAVALFNNSNAVQFVTVELMDRFQLLAERKIDVLANTATHNLQRDVYFGKSTDSGFTFSKPFVYSGLAFWGPAEYLHCAETFDTETGLCKDLTICVAAFTTHEFLLRALFPHQVLVPFTSALRLVANIDDGTCRALAAEIFYTNARSIPNREAMAGTKLFSNEPLSLVTREDDHQWSSFVNSVVNAFFLAEANGISKGNAEDMQQLVGPALSPMLVPVIQEFGNYADLYNSHLQSLVPRHGLNVLYTKDDQSGLLYDFPLGISIGKGPEPDPNGLIARVLDRGHLKCGVVVADDDRDAPMSGFDTEFCRALAAGLFGGSTEALEVTKISAAEAAFQALDGGEFDVAAGMRLHLLAGYREPTTGKGFFLSMPYYYDTTAMQAYGFATTADDPKWSDLVNWVVMATIHAATMRIRQSEADKMPKVGLFGKNLNLYQDVVRVVGSYNEIYERTLEAFVPQAGSGNEVNHNRTGPQIFPLPYL